MVQWRLIPDPVDPLVSADFFDYYSGPEFATVYIEGGRVISIRRYRMYVRQAAAAPLVASNWPFESLVKYFYESFDTTCNGLRPCLLLSRCGPARNASTSPPCPQESFINRSVCWKCPAGRTSVGGLATACSPKARPANVTVGGLDPTSTCPLTVSAVIPVKFGSSTETKLEVYENDDSPLFVLRMPVPLSRTGADYWPISVLLNATVLPKLGHDEYAVRVYLCDSSVCGTAVSTRTPVTLRGVSRPPPPEVATVEGSWVRRKLLVVAPIFVGSELRHELLHYRVEERAESSAGTSARFLHNITATDIELDEYPACTNDIVRYTYRVAAVSGATQSVFSEWSAPLSCTAARKMPQWVHCCFPQTVQRLQYLP